MRKLSKILFTHAVIVGVISLCATLSTSAAVRTSHSNPNNQYKLIWSDEFDGDALDLDNWGIEQGGHGWGNNEAQTYTDSEENLKVKGGCLIITAKADKSSGSIQYTSARVNSSGKTYFKYGKMEARIKLPNDRGTWPAFWMLGQFEPKGWPYCGEIDILETWNDLNFAQGTLHWEDEIQKPKKDKYDATSTKMIDKTQWHTYGITWTPTTIEWTLDNNVFKTIDISTSDKSEIRKEFYFIINCAIGGNLAYFLPVDSFESTDMKVDYVRVYQRAADKPTASFKSNDKNLVDRHSVIFESNDYRVSVQTLRTGETAVFPKVTRKGYKFAGWYMDGIEIKENTRFFNDADAHIVAKWIKIKNGKVTLKKVKQTYKKYATVKFSYKKSGGQKADGFQVKVGKKTTTTPSKIALLGKFKSKKKYKAKVRAYQIDSQGNKIYGKWSKQMKIKIK